MDSSEKADKVKYWAKRLECPVDEDAGYHNTFVR
jgi:nucleobase:cation symporter-1, NCS1 family